MNRLKQIVLALRKERQAVQNKIEAIDTGLKALQSLNGYSSGKRRMSRAARMKIAAAQRARWAKIKKAA